MIDIRLTEDHDLHIDKNLGDIGLTESPRQAIKIRLLWFKGEWRFARTYGFPYFEEVFIKNFNRFHIRGEVRSAIMEVPEVKSIPDVGLLVDDRTREARITFTAIVDGDDLKDEVILRAGSS